MTRRPRIMLSAGEASGDRLGAGLARALTERRPDVELIGMGGDEMAAAGVTLVEHAANVAVVGIVEVIRHLPAIVRAMKSLRRVLVEEQPDLVVPIDFPDFNLRLSNHAARAGVPVVYFVSPQVWAWRRGRVHRVRRLVRRMLVLFPFEVPFYEAAGVPVTFVGHPAADRSEETVDPRRALEAAGLDPSRPTVALLPGSRSGEATRHLPRMLAAARLLKGARGELQFVVPRAQTLPANLVERLIAAHDPGSAVRISSGHYPAILRACATGVVASGTATLDAALAGLPTVVVYTMQPVSYMLARRLVKVDHIALPNLVAGTRVFPELVQDAFTPEAVATIVGRWLDEPAEAEQVRRALDVVRGRLEGEDAFRRAAVAVLRELDARSL